MSLKTGGYLAEEVQPLAGNHTPLQNDKKTPFCNTSEKARCKIVEIQHSNNLFLTSCEQQRKQMSGFLTKLE